MSVGSSFKFSWDKMIDTVGTTFEVERHGVDGETEKHKLHFVQAGNDDLAIINSLGLDARIAQCKADAALKRHDLVTSPTDKVYTIEAAHEVFVQDVLVGYRIYMV